MSHKQSASHKLSVSHHTHCQRHTSCQHHTSCQRHTSCQHHTSCQRHTSCRCQQAVDVTQAVNVTQAPSRESFLTSCSKISQSVSNRCIGSLPRSSSSLPLVSVAYFIHDWFVLVQKRETFGNLKRTRCSCLDENQMTFLNLSLKRFTTTKVNPIYLFKF